MPWYSRWHNVFRSEQLSHEIDDELQYHLAQSADDLVASGMSEAEAWRVARRRLGNYSVQKESTRDGRLRMARFRPSRSRLWHTPVESQPWLCRRGDSFARPWHRR